MALTRKFLSALGIDADKIDEIITAHSETVTALKEERDKYKKDAEKLPSVEQELETLKKDSAEQGEWKSKFDKEHEAFEQYKSDVDAKDRATKLKNAYSKLLTECKVGEKQIDAILKVTDFSSMKLTDDGSLEDADKLKEGINSTWSGFISSTETAGAKVETPPRKDDRGGKATRAAELAAKYHENLYGKRKEN